MIKKLFCVLFCLLFSIPQMIVGTAAEKIFHTIPLPEDVSWMSYALYQEGEKIEASGTEMAPIGSVSKTYAATMTMLLVEEGRLSLDAPVCQYLPGFTMRDERYRDITVRMLLNHTAGFYGSTLKNTMLYGESSRWNHDHFLSMLSEQSLKYAPGTMASYSNDGYTLLELVIETVTGESYRDSLKNRLFKPLALKDTCVSGEYTGEIKDRIQSYAAGGLFATADELCAFGDALTLPERLLTKESLEEMLKGDDTSFKKGTYDFGLGWDDISLYPFDEAGIQAATKNGDTLYYHTSLVIVPSFGITAAVLTKGGTSVACQMMAEKLIIDFLKSQGLSSLTYRTRAYEEGDVLEATECLPYEGFYLSTLAQYVLKITAYGAILSNVYTGSRTVFDYRGEGRFTNRASTLTIEDTGDEVYLYLSGYVPYGEEAYYAYGDYIAVRRTSEAFSSDVWRRRDGHAYLLCDEDYRSQLYINTLPKTSVYFTEEAPCYVGYMKIYDDMTALSDIALPGASGRDVSDFRFFSEGEKDYLLSQGWTFIDVYDVPDIYSGPASFCTILSGGFARWFHIREAGGKRMNVEITGGSGMYTVYEESGKRYQSSLQSTEAVLLPEDGYIVFAGDIGTVFQITLD